MKESDFQSRLIRELKDRFPDCIILKNDPTYIQGIPDIIVLWNYQWAALECKKNSRARLRPNQRYYIDQMDRMSFAAVVYPENKDEILDQLEEFMR